MKNFSEINHKKFSMIFMIVMVANVVIEEKRGDYQWLV